MEILVVDDELAIRKGLAALLEESGYSVRTARDGIAGPNRAGPVPRSSSSQHRKNIMHNVPAVLSPHTRQIVTAAGYVCPQVMTPKTFLDNLNMEAENA